MSRQFGKETWDHWPCGCYKESAILRWPCGCKMASVKMLASESRRECSGCRASWDAKELNAWCAAELERRRQLEAAELAPPAPEPAGPPSEGPPEQGEK